MKRNVAEYVAQCPLCQLVKAKHQRPARQLQPLEVLMWKLDQIAMDFVVALPKCQVDKMSYESLLIDSQKAPTSSPSRLQILWAS
jgi:hypothetical protein